MSSHDFIEESYDCLVEIVNSPWRNSLERSEPVAIQDSVRDKRHFAVFFSSNGYLEVIADGFEELPPSAVPAR
jgi:hypothetical protein